MDLVIGHKAVDEYNMVSDVRQLVNVKTIVCRRHRKKVTWKQPPEMNFSSDGNMNEMASDNGVIVRCSYERNRWKGYMQRVLFVIGEEAGIFLTPCISRKQTKTKLHHCSHILKDIAYREKNVTMERYKFNT